MKAEKAEIFFSKIILSETQLEEFEKLRASGIIVPELKEKRGYLLINRENQLISEVLKYAVWFESLENLDVKIDVFVVSHITNAALEVFEFELEWLNKTRNIAYYEALNALYKSIRTKIDSFTETRFLGYFLITDDIVTDLVLAGNLKTLHIFIKNEPDKTHTKSDFIKYIEHVTSLNQVIADKDFKLSIKRKIEKLQADKGHLYTQTRIYTEDLGETISNGYRVVPEADLVEIISVDTTKYDLVFLEFPRHLNYGKPHKDPSYHHCFSSLGDMEIQREENKLFNACANKVDKGGVLVVRGTLEDYRNYCTKKVDTYASIYHIPFVYRRPAFQIQDGSKFTSTVEFFFVWFNLYYNLSIPNGNFIPATLGDYYDKGKLINLKPYSFYASLVEKLFPTGNIRIFQPFCTGGQLLAYGYSTGISVVGLDTEQSLKQLSINNLGGRL